MTYSQKLKDPRWQKKRLEILQRDNFACQCCGDTESTLHVHHKKYFFKKDPWEIDNKYLETLCEECHNDVEENKKSINEVIAKLSAYELSNLSICYIIADGLLDETLLSKFGPNDEDVWFSRCVDIINNLPTTQNMRRNGLEGRLLNVLKQYSEEYGLDSQNFDIVHEYNSLYERLGLE